MRLEVSVSVETRVDCKNQTCRAQAMPELEMCEGHAVGGLTAFPMVFHDIPRNGQWGFERQSLYPCYEKPCIHETHAYYVYHQGYIGNYIQPDVPVYYCLLHAKELWDKQRNTSSPYLSVLREMKAGALEEVLIDVWNLLNLPDPKFATKIRERLAPIFEPTALEKCQRELKWEKSERARERKSYEDTISVLKKRLEEKK